MTYSCYINEIYIIISYITKISNPHEHPFIKSLDHNPITTQSTQTKNNITFNIIISHSII